MQRSSYACICRYVEDDDDGSNRERGKCDSDRIGTSLWPPVFPTSWDIRNIYIGMWIDRDSLTRCAQGVHVSPRDLAPSIIISSSYTNTFCRCVRSNGVKYHARTQMAILNVLRQSPRPYQCKNRRIIYCSRPHKQNIKTI